MPDFLDYTYTEGDKLLSISELDDGYEVIISVNDTDIVYFLTYMSLSELVSVLINTGLDIEDDFLLNDQFICIYDLQVALNYVEYRTQSRLNRT